MKLFKWNLISDLDLYLERQYNLRIFKDRIKHLEEETFEQRKEIDRLKKENQMQHDDIKQLKEKMDEILDRNIKYNVEIVDLQQENQQLKEVIEEVREYINHEWFKRGQLGIIDKSFQEWQLKDILQILDKVDKNYVY